MKKYFFLFLILIFLSFFGCSKKPDLTKKVYYFYDDGKVFQKEKGKHMIRYVYRYPILEDINDTFKYNQGICVFFLDYYEGDPVFAKQRSFLDSIQYNNADWLKKDSNLILFWRSVDNETSYQWRVDWESYYKFDSLTIYYIEKIENSDSLLFRRVNRDVLWAQ